MEIKQNCYGKRKYDDFGERITNLARMIVITVKHRDALRWRPHDYTEINVVVESICFRCGDEPPWKRTKQSEVIKVEQSHIAETDSVLMLIHDVAKVLRGRYFGNTLKQPRVLVAGLDRISRAVLLQQAQLFAIDPNKRWIDINVQSSRSDKCSRCGRDVERSPATSSDSIEEEVDADL